MSFKPRNFREWCNHTIPVLPQVYGDELSYYELLNKVVEKLNAMGITVNELIDYVNTYFDSKDWQHMVNNKLDSMSADGTLDNIINQQIFSELNSKVTDNTNSINSLKTNKKIVFIGDSYAEGYSPDGNVIGWPTIIKNTIPTYTIYGKYEGGSGVIARGYNGNTFEMLLTQLASSISSDERNSISYVVIGGGYNDYSSNDPDIERAIAFLSKKARELFPNAFLYYCIIGWTTDPDIRSRIRTMATRITTYLGEPIEMNVVTSTMLCLHNYNFFSSDGVHPNQAGQKNIANAILRVINGGNTLQLYEYIEVHIPKEDLINTAENDDNPNYMTCGCSINNGVLSITMEGRVRTTITEIPTPIANLKTLPYFRRGWDGPPITQWMCWLQGFTDENKWVSGIGFLKVDHDGNLSVFHRITDENGFARLNFTNSISFCNISLSGGICNSYDL